MRYLIKNAPIKDREKRINPVPSRNRTHDLASFCSRGAVEAVLTPVAKFFMN